MVLFLRLKRRRTKEQRVLYVEADMPEWDWDNSEHLVIREACGYPDETCVPTLDDLEAEGLAWQLDSIAQRIREGRGEC